MARHRVRNARAARRSFVTRRTEARLDALARLFQKASGSNWLETTSDTLQRELVFRDYRYLESLRLVYNWENRFMSVNYNLQMICRFPTITHREFVATKYCLFELQPRQPGFRAGRSYTWRCRQWQGSPGQQAAYLARLQNPLILQRLASLDIMEMDIRCQPGRADWQVSCESLIGSATWILIPPVLQMIAPSLTECVRFLELFELLGDAVVNNSA